MVGQEYGKSPFVYRPVRDEHCAECRSQEPLDESTSPQDVGKYRDALIAEYHKYPALPPVFDFMDNEAPAKVRRLKPVWTEDGYILFWTAPKYEEEMNRAVRYVVYRFGAKEAVDIDDPSHIVAITRDNFYKLPYEDGKTKYRYVVTALDRLHNESKSVGKKIKL